MKEVNVFSTKFNNHYIYLRNNIFFIPQGLLRALRNNLNSEVANRYKDICYYNSKKKYLQKQGLLEFSHPKFNTRIEPETIKSYLADLKQILIEVTDDCNLACKYCGYRELYVNHDSREGKKQTIERTRILIDYFLNNWNSMCRSLSNDLIAIGFYGGEPLMNFKLIRSVIQYIEQKDTGRLRFEFNMTSNGLLLHKYMDFLAEKKFRLLISLDGNRFSNSYRITKNGKNSFDSVYKNVRLLMNSYPQYFNEYVNFNAVLHNRNNLRSIHDFILTEFGKVPRISQLNTNGISEVKKEEFYEIFQSKTESYKSQLISDLADIEDLMSNPKIRILDNFIRGHLESSFSSLNELMKIGEVDAYFPTGTCQPFQRKIFLTVNGKLLPCEKIGQNYPLCFVNDKEVEIDFSKVSDLYYSFYSKLEKLCSACFQWKSCGQCIFLMEEGKTSIKCPGFLPRSKADNFLSELVSLAEEHRFLHSKLSNEIVIV